MLPPLSRLVHLISSTRAGEAGDMVEFILGSCTRSVLDLFRRLVLQHPLDESPSNPPQTPDPAAYDRPHIEVALTRLKGLGPEMRDSNLKVPIKVHKYHLSSVPSHLQPLPQEKRHHANITKMSSKSKSKPASSAPLYTSQYKSELLLTQKLRPHPYPSSHHCLPLLRSSSMQ